MRPRGGRSSDARLLYDASGKHAVWWGAKGGGTVVEREAKEISVAKKMRAAANLNSPLGCCRRVLTTCRSSPLQSTTGVPAASVHIGCAVNEERSHEIIACLVNI